MNDNSFLNITDSQIQRVKKTWEDIAKEPLEIQTGETVSDPIYAYGSELAVLRLFKAMHVNGKCGFSENLNSWYFVNK